MSILAGIVFGFILWFLVRYLVAGLFTVDYMGRECRSAEAQYGIVLDASLITGAAEQRGLFRSFSRPAMSRRSVSHL